MQIKKMNIFIFILLIIFTLFGCSPITSISGIYYVDSFGLDYSDNEYTVYLHISNPTTLITQEQGSENVQIKYSTCRSKGETIFKAMSNIMKYTNLTINLGLIESLILSKNFISNENIEHLYDYLKSTPKIFPTFNIYYTDESLDDIFSLSNPKSVSPFYSLIGENLTEPLLPEKNYARFISEFFEDKLTLSIPIIKLDNEIWKDENEKIISLSIDGVCAMNKESNTVATANLKDYPGLIFLFKEQIEEQSIEINKKIIQFEYYNIKLKHNDNNIIISINTIASIVNSHDDKGALSKEIQKYIEYELIKVINYFNTFNIDIINIKDYIYRYNINELTNIDFNINVSI